MKHVNVALVCYLFEVRLECQGEFCIPGLFVISRADVDVTRVGDGGTLTGGQRHAWTENK